MQKHRLSGSIMGFLSMMGGESVDVKNLFNIDFETGDLSQFDAVVNPDDDLSVGVAGAMGGTSQGLSVIIDDQNPVYGVKTLTSPASGKFRVRFYFDPNGLTMAGADTFDWFFWFDTGGSALYVFAVQLIKSAAVWAPLMHYCVDGGYGGAQQGGDFADAPQYIEFYAQRSSSAVANDGRIDWWVDGAVQTAITGIDNYDLWETMDSLFLGAYANVDVGTSGIFFIDEFAANDNGEEIGA